MYSKLLVLYANINKKTMVCVYYVHVLGAN